MYVWLTVVESVFLFFSEFCGIFFSRCELEQKKQARVKTACNYTKVAFFSAQKPQAVEWIQGWL